jgi:acetyl esterase/lipase
VSVVEVCRGAPQFHRPTVLAPPSSGFRIRLSAAVVRGLIALGAACAGLHTHAQTPPATPARSILDRLSPEARAHHESTAVRLWETAAPGAAGEASEDIPLLYPVLPVEPALRPRPAILVFAGGSYTFHSAAEAFPIAERFREAGFAAFVLKYRLHPYPRSIALSDAQRAVRVLRSRSAAFALDPEQIAAIGFSAGGHLAANLSTHGDEGNATAADPVERFNCRIQSALLFYPAILATRIDRAAVHRSLPELLELDGLHQQVDARTTPTFMIVGYDDVSTPYEHCLAYASRLHLAGVRFELHVLGAGGHGGSVREARRDAWEPLALQWLTTCGFSVRR